MLSYFKTNRYNAGFYAGSLGLLPASGTEDYMKGYNRAVSLLQESVEQLEESTKARRKAEEYVRRAHAKMEAVKRVVAENL